MTRVTEVPVATKLTLTLEGEVIEKAKSYAKQRGTSVSKLVEAYFERLTAKEDVQLSGIVAELAGVLKDVDVDALQDDYARHLDRKYR